MTKVERRLIADGKTYEVACAVRADGTTSPVARFLDELKGKRWVSQLDADEQIRAYAWVLAAIEYFADSGDFPHVGDWNQLMNGIWEIKHWNLRISFFDTDGLGNFDPKVTQRVYVAGGGYCPLPEFDEFIRLGTVFEKRTAKTPSAELALAAQIRNEDLAHDKG